MRQFNVFIIVLLFWCSSKCSADKKELQNYVAALRKELFQNRNYDLMARPVLNYTHPTNVSITFSISYIIDLDLQTNILESGGWIILSWKDENLKWDPFQYDNLAEIRVRAEEIYRPDITIVNSVYTENVIRSNTHSDLILQSNGLLVWVPMISMKTICKVDLTEWPFDRQTCEFSFASWTYSTTGMNLHDTIDKIDLMDFVENAEWEAVNSRSEFKLHDFGEKYQYPEIIYYLIIERKTTIYRYTVYLPVLCAILVNLMTLFLDVENRLRLYLSGLSFLTLFLILLYLGNKLSFGSLGVPKVVKYLCQMLILAAVTMMWSAFAFNFTKSTKYQMPPTVMRALEPMHRWLVSRDIESVPLADSDDNGPPRKSVATKQATEQRYRHSSYR